MITYENDHYLTRNTGVAFLARVFPSFFFYFHLILIILQASRKAQKGRYNGKKWTRSSYDVMRKLEAIGLKIDIKGIENVKKVEGPLVIVGNHMSMMETLLLPVMIQPEKDVTFVIKESLLNYPVFKHVIRSRNPVAVTRTNPRQDLKTVMSEGVDRLDSNVSVIVFPQTTRAATFDPAQMSSIGVKLAKKAGVPVVPLALKTDAWENGKQLKDFGRINVNKTAYFSFGEPMSVTGKGGSEQQAVNDFITTHHALWNDAE